jgi:hypothetical protein
VAVLAAGSRDGSDGAGREPAGIGGLDPEVAGERVGVGEAHPVDLEQRVGVLARHVDRGRAEAGVHGADDRDGQAGGLAQPHQRRERPTLQPALVQLGGHVRVEPRLADQPGRRVLDDAAGAGTEDRQDPLDVLVRDLGEALAEQERPQTGDRRRRGLLVVGGLEGRPVPGVLGPAPHETDGLSLDEIGERSGGADRVTAVVGELGHAEAGRGVGVDEAEHLARDLLTSEQRIHVRRGCHTGATRPGRRVRRRRDPRR